MALSGLETAKVMLGKFTKTPDHLKMQELAHWSRKALQEMASEGSSTEESDGFKKQVAAAIRNTTLKHREKYALHVEELKLAREVTGAISA